MVCESNIAQERRVQLQQHRVYKATKNMPPTPTTYSLRSRGPPTTTIECPIRVWRVSRKVADNQDIEATQAQLAAQLASQLAAKAAIDAFQPVVQALTMQLTQLTVALEEQRVNFTRQYKAL
jgi:hypothetical protein